mmetsp:Transcript_1261/g.5587  ORF Transcript_1261/g.5587 Transcript_1261/m.5587 type:complete len:398 (+) Transcript_1261:586-1779(+)
MCDPVVCGIASCVAFNRSARTKPMDDAHRMDARASLALEGHLQRRDVLEPRALLGRRQKLLLRLHHRAVGDAVPFAVIILRRPRRRALRLVPQLLLPRLQVLLPARLALEHLVDRLLLVGLHHAEALAELHERRGAVGGADGDEPSRGRIRRGAVALDVKRGQRFVRHLHAQRRVVLLVVVVPHVHLAVHLDREKDTRARGRPRATREVRPVVPRGHDRRLDVLHPHPRGPVPDGHEVLREPRVPLKRVHRPVVAVERSPDAIGGRLRLAVAHQNRTLLRPDHKLGGARDGLVLHAHRAEHGVAAPLLQQQLLDWFPEPANIPPIHVPIRGNREALGASLALEPVHVVARVSMRLFNRGQIHRVVALAGVPVRNLTVVQPAGEDVRILRVVVDAAQL